MNDRNKDQLDRAHARLLAGLASYALGVPEDDVTARTRSNQAAARARKIAMYLAHVGLGMSLARVALVFGRDRSTVAIACRQIEDDREDLAFDAWISRLEAVVQAVPAPEFAEA